ncbi:hypothetical protein, partial [Candidatus Parabeggiatoa sp. HSG14]|uniref:hypothetical protein n=1 Tax=Candidatus Parabeggiatoa sp. HSG14 TaxID=3055593 RepID=UPI0025A86154|nr:hypothetical protein [Thiotrichales bacterium HSG14]
MAELIAAIELNNFTIIKGAFIIGAIWNFIILEKFGIKKYQYFVNRNYDIDVQINSFTNQKIIAD